jgi:hypothetical protein
VYSSAPTMLPACSRSRICVYRRPPRFLDTILGMAAADGSRHQHRGAPGDLRCDLIVPSGDDGAGGACGVPAAMSESGRGWAPCRKLVKAFSARLSSGTD